MKKIMIALVAMLAMTISANAANYSLDESAINEMFAEATVSTSVESQGILDGVDGQTRTLIAACLEFTGLAGIGIHRLVLGTEPINCLWYFITFGGIFYIVPTVDFIVELIDLLTGSGTAYLNNPKFIMWL